MTGIWELHSGQYHPAPAVSFSSRSFLRVTLSRLFAPLMTSCCRRRDLVRLELHPADARHPAVLETINLICAGKINTRHRITIGEYLRIKGTKPGAAGII